MNLASLKTKACIWAGDSRSSTFFPISIIISKAKAPWKENKYSSKERCSSYQNEAGKVTNSSHNAIQSLSVFFIMINLFFFFWENKMSIFLLNFLVSLKSQVGMQTRGSALYDYPWTGF